MMTLQPFRSANMIDSWLPHGVGLRCVFEQRGDRLAHEFALVQRENDQEIASLIASSQEGQPQEAWPSSSPLQSLSIETRPTGNVALLVGMAGRSHWSASFEAVANSGRIVVEHACRVGGEPGWLGSGYALSPDWECVGEFTWQLQHHRVRCITERGQWASPTLSIPALQPVARPPVQWRYEWCVEV